MTVAFPRRFSARWLLLVLAVVALGVAGLLASSSTAAGGAWPLPLGIALVLVAIRIGDQAPRIAALEGSEERGAVTFVLGDGAAFEIPRTAVAEVKVTTHTQSSGSSGGNRRRNVTHGVALRKNDGGVITLMGEGHRKHIAESLAGRVEEILEATPEDEAVEAELVEDARRTLEEAPHVTIADDTDAGGYRDRAATALEVRWPLAQPWSKALAAPLAAAGVALSAAGVAVAVESRIPYAISALLGAATLYGLYRAVLDRSSIQLMRVDHARLKCERKRGDDVLEEKDIPVAGVDAIDIDWQRGIVVRLDGANEEIRKLTEAATSGKGVIAAVTQGVIAMTRKTVHLPTGALSLHERLAIELVIGAEVARRSDRRAGDL